MPRTAHHTALLQAMQIPSIQSLLRRALFYAVRDAFGANHRLREVLVGNLAQLALKGETVPSVLSHMLMLCGGRLERLLRVTGGKVDAEWVSFPRPENGLVDSIRWLLQRNDEMAWNVLRMFVLPLCV